MKRYRTYFYRNAYGYWYWELYEVCSERWADEQFVTRQGAFPSELTARLNRVYYGLRNWR